MLRRKATTERVVERRVFFEPASRPGVGPENDDRSRRKGGAHNRLCPIYVLKIHLRGVCVDRSDFHAQPLTERQRKATSLAYER